MRAARTGLRFDADFRAVNRTNEAGARFRPSLLGACPTGVVFVPSIGGVAHDEAEATAPADLDAGLAVLLRAAHRLCRAGCDPVAAARRDLGGPA